MQTIDLQPLNSRTITFDEFVAMSDAKRAEIARVRFVVPELGFGALEDERAFGEIIVSYKHPVYAADFTHRNRTKSFAKRR